MAVEVALAIACLAAFALGGVTSAVIGWATGYRRGILLERDHARNLVASIGSTLDRNATSTIDGGDAVSLTMCRAIVDESLEMIAEGQHHPDCWARLTTG